MQPPEPTTGPAPVLPAAGMPPRAPKPPNRRLRLWLAMGAGILALLCLGGAGVFVSLYDEATAIDRATPDQVTSSFLRAYLNERNDNSAALYSCESAKFDAIADLRTEMEGREKKFGTSVRATWGSLAISGAGDEHRTVSVTLTIAGWSDNQQVSGREEVWRFGLVNQDGWRVCDAIKS